MTADKLKLSDRLAEKRTDLAAKRTLLAAERSLMAWIRTGLSMIGFGFTIYAFFESLLLNKNELMMNLDNPRKIGMFLLGMGILSVLFGSFQYLIFIKEVQKIAMIKAGKFPLIIAGLICLLGIVLFFTLFVKIHFL